MSEFQFEALAQAELVVDALYRGGRSGNAGDDPLSKLLAVGNQGGFRKCGRGNQTRYCILYSSLADNDWPDALYPENGRFVYYGDNKTAGKELHDTKQGGNRILQYAFDEMANGRRASVPPFFIFTKSVEGRDVHFRGLAVPGAPDLQSGEALVAIWRSNAGQRFQNYRAVLTILDVPTISREWIDDLEAGNHLTTNAPRAWAKWVRQGAYTPLVAPPTKRHRTKDEQLPTDRQSFQLVQTIVDYFNAHPRKAYAFEECAIELAWMMLPSISAVELTRPSSDGGRDAVGTYRIGSNENGIHVTFALEAKCWKVTSGCGVGETKRLLSRVRHREFGIFVTTSFVSEQAYRELAEDRLPIVVVCAVDIVRLLRAAGHGTSGQVKQWLAARFPYA